MFSGFYLKKRGGNGSRLQSDVIVSRHIFEVNFEARYGSSEIK